MIENKNPPKIQKIDYIKIKSIMECVLQLLHTDNHRRTFMVRARNDLTELWTIFHLIAKRNSAKDENKNNWSDVCSFCNLFEHKYSKQFTLLSNDLVWFYLLENISKQYVAEEYQCHRHRGKCLKCPEHLNSIIILACWTQSPWTFHRINFVFEPWATWSNEMLAMPSVFGPFFHVLWSQRNRQQD